VRGKRVTDKATVEVVEMILSGLVNKRIVQAINDAGGRAVGLSGKDDDLMVCVADDPELGFVGRPVEMNVQVLRDLYMAGIIPVVAPVATGMEENETFNVNGDTAAGAIAGALQADRLLLLTDVAGVKEESGEVVSQLDSDRARAMIESGTIKGGMIPKVETALGAIDAGVRAVVILDGACPTPRWWSSSRSTAQARSFEAPRPRPGPSGCERAAASPSRRGRPALATMRQRGSRGRRAPLLPRTACPRFRSVALLAPTSRGSGRSFASAEARDGAPDPLDRCARG
jgi:acetylglutamate kinase